VLVKLFGRILLCVVQTLRHLSKMDKFEKLFELNFGNDFGWGKICWRNLKFVICKLKIIEKS